MDAQAVDMEVLSINPFWYGRDRDLAGQIVKIQNEKLAELCASKPDRFAAFASLTLQAPDLAVQELETAVKKQGLKGAAIGGVVAGVEFSDPKFNPVWAKAEELGVPLFIHPQGVPELGKRLSGNGWLGNTIGNPLETTIALSHLIFDGTLDRFPGLKVIAAHGGGYLPSYADRSDHACMVGPAGCDPKVVLKKKPTEYLKQLYFDSLIFTPEALRHLAAQVGAGQIVLGSDYPYPLGAPSGRPHLRHDLAQRRREGGDPRHDGGEDPEHQDLDRRREEVMAVQALQKDTSRNPRTVEEARLFVKHVESLFMPWNVDALVDGFTEDCVVRFGTLPPFHGREVLRTFFVSRSARQKNYRLTKQFRTLMGDTITNTWDGQLGGCRRRASP